MGTRDYYIEQREREPLIRTLVAECGLSYEDTAELIGCSATTVKNDVEAYGGLDAFAPSRPSQQDRFAAAFVRYAQCANGLRHDPDQKILRALESWIGIKAHVASADMALGALTVPQYAKGQENYYCLAIAIFGPPSGPDPLDGWRAFLEEIARLTIQAPRDLREAKGVVTRRMADEIRNFVAPTWPHDAAERMEAALAVLDENEREVIRRRFGLGREGETLEQIGRSLKTTRERVRQAEHKALRKLRSRTVRDDLLPLVSPLSNVEEWKLKDRLQQEEAAAIEAAAAERPALTEFQEVLLRRIENLELSTRTGNCLSNAGIEYVWQLVEKSEYDMLKSKNFGRKSLNEINFVLGTLGLRLGMVLPPLPRKASAE